MLRVHSLQKPVLQNRRRADSTLEKSDTEPSDNKSRVRVDPDSEHYGPDPFHCQYDPECVKMTQKWVRLSPDPGQNQNFKPVSESA